MPRPIVMAFVGRPRGWVALLGVLALTSAATATPYPAMPGASQGARRSLFHRQVDDESKPKRGHDKVAPPRKQGKRKKGDAPRKSAEDQDGAHGGKKKTRKAAPSDTGAAESATKADAGDARADQPSSDGTETQSSKPGSAESTAAKGNRRKNALAAATTAQEQKPADERKVTKPQASDQETAKQDQPDKKPAGSAADVQEQVRFETRSGSDLLKYIDDLKLGLLSGSDVTVEIIGDNKILLKGNARDVDQLEALIRIIDQTTPSKVVQIVTLMNRDASDVAKAVESALEDVFPLTTPQEQRLKLTALSGNVLLVAALPDHMDLVLKVISQVDATTPTVPEGELLRFELKNRKASEVAPLIEDMLKKMQAQLGISGQELTITANDADNRISVFAPASEKDKIQAIIDTFDVAPKEDWGEVRMAMFPLLHSDAGTFAQVLEDLLQNPENRDAATETIFRLSMLVMDPKTGDAKQLEPIDLTRTIRIIPDEGTNSLLIATVEKNIGGFAELIRLLDAVPLAEDVDVAIVPLRFAEATNLKATLDKLFSDAKKTPFDPGTKEQDPMGEGVPRGEVGQGIVHNLAVEANSRANTLLIVGKAETVALAKRIAESVDVPFREKYPIRLIKVVHSDALRISKVLEALLEQRMSMLDKVADGMAVERERVYLTVDVYSNSLIVSANEENLAELEDMVRQLDVEHKGDKTQFGIIPCRRLSALDISQKLIDLWQRTTKLRSEADQFDDEPVIVVDERSNSLLVSASPEDFEQLKRLVEALESKSPADNTQIFKLRFADANQIATQLDDLFQGLSDLMGTQTRPTFIPDARSNSVIVAATQSTMERVEELVGRLDVQAGPTTAQLQLYRLEFASAVKLATKMQKVFDDRRQGSNSETTPIVIVPDEGSNTLIVSASRDEQEVVQDLLKLLDRKSQISEQVQIFPLRMARAPDVADKLESLFNQADSESGRPDAIAVEADERLNALIVWASPAQMEGVAEMIEKIDMTRPTRRMGFRVLRLHQAIAPDFADVLQNALFGDNEDQNAAVIVSYVHERDDGTREEKQLLRQDVRFTADERTNSLMVYAPEESMDALTSIIRQIDEMRPIKSELRLFELVNSDAQTVADMLQQLYDQSGSQEGGNIRTSIELQGFGSVDMPSSVGQALRFAADRRTNTLIAAGAEIDLQMVEGLVRYLDAIDIENRTLGVYNPINLDPTDLAQSVTEFLQQEEEPYQELEGETSDYRRQERHVSLVSVGGSGQDERGAGVIIGASQRKLPHIMDLLHQLDRPEPQVRISVLVAEVILDDRVELGIEFAAQDLEFSERAVLGPNGTILGPSDLFDFVAGTDIGAVGPGGFSFTVTGEDFNFLLRALQTESKLEVLSRPTVMVENNKNGRVDIGDRIPIPQTSNLADNVNRVQTSFTYQDVGIVLDVVPHITPDGYVRLDLVTEISQLSNQTITLTEGLTAPVINQRRMESSVTIKDGETVVLGGLITSSQEHGETKVPILGDLPGIGVLFRSARDVARRTELITVLTVEVMRTPDEMYDMSQRELGLGASSEWIRQHKLMEGLRIRPDKSLLGPREDQIGPQRLPNGANPMEQPGRERELYGPKPRRYGPDLSKPIAQYGPRVEPTPTRASASRNSKTATTKGRPADSTPAGTKTGSDVELAEARTSRDSDAGRR